MSAPMFPIRWGVRHFERHIARYPDEGSLAMCRSTIQLARVDCGVGRPARRILLCKACMRKIGIIRMDARKVTP